MDTFEWTKSVGGVWVIVKQTQLTLIIVSDQLWSIKRAIKISFVDKLARKTLYPDQSYTIAYPSVSRKLDKMEISWDSPKKSQNSKNLPNIDTNPETWKKAFDKKLIKCFFDNFMKM